ncbi:MAG: hypothetical protein HYW89_03045 [Candidatus Sungiibacteriota bacterium]|uniref:Haloacid dehalogenase n=1 Tax=Candidatus Sungiibacteriota bacterium TaxID=2750080 RepID=A0A7T5RIU4_9BACT|nr:MAG: hypothetical protein HYW89_03045 [Candidatus Sungbacteria bacterium]
MVQVAAEKPKKRKGIIIWDFDRVLFNTEKYFQDNAQVFRTYNIPEDALRHAVDNINNSDATFSTAALCRELKKMGLYCPVSRARRTVNQSLSRYRYIDAAADQLLHRLKRRGFIHFLLSFGNGAYQGKKIKIAGGKTLRHFEKLIVTGKPKHVFIKRIARRYFDLPIFFIDDTRSHIELVQKYIPRVCTIHYSGRLSLRDVERTILNRHAD